MVRAHMLTDELRAVLVSPVVAEIPRPRGGWAVQGILAAVLAGGHAAEQFPARDD
jgi:hypothetical protein